MPTPDRRSDRHSSRRSPEQQQQSPFRRAHRDPHHLDYNFDHSRLSPGDKDRARHRRTFSQTQTLRGAFEAASRVPRMAEDFPQTTSYARGTPSPRRRQSAFAFSPESNPPNELEDIYQRINDADSLVDLEDPDEDLYLSGEQPRNTRNRRLSSGSGFRGNANGHQDDIFTTSDGLGEIADEHVKDEQRLRRATTNQSPVLSRSGTPLALTAENLQRREEEVQEHAPDDDGDDLKPSLNLPSTWGSRATQRRGWMRDIGRRNQSVPQEEKKEERKEPANSSTPKSSPGMDLRAKLAKASERSPARPNLTSRSALGERSTSNYNRISPAKEGTGLSPEQKNHQSTEGDVIPNTPIIVYKNSTFNKRSPTKRDSHTLLRKLSRTESPGQIHMQTPEAQKLPDRQNIYDKTPVVTGAWIDTPMTERATEPPMKIPPPVEPPTPIKEEPEQPSQQAEPQWTGSQRTEPERTQPQVDVQPKQEVQPKNNLLRKRPSLIKPNLPKSGLENIMQDAKTDKDSYEFGDDTIESLQLILDEQPTETKGEDEDDAAYEKAILEKLKLANAAGKSAVDVDQLDEKFFDRFNDKVKLLVQNISEAQKGLSGLEEQVARDTAIFSARLASGKDPKQPHQLHAGENCETCGVQSDGRLYASIRLPRLWTRDSVSRRIRLTLLGWFITISLVWFFSESTMCDYYCHPLVSDVCEGNCLRPDAPQFPFVIPTMMWRWSHLSTILAPVITMVVAFFRLIAQLMGFWDGYVDDIPRAVNLSGEIRIHGTRITDFPAAATSSRSTFSSPKRWQGQSQESVPKLKLDHNTPVENLGDDPSIDDDEYL
ncbi:hypothetical protein ASPWEDRAFT_37047 [Aspergillus wentii DTO 134E9]|uniref:Uncharacterized protein n=1 Tax=Aspergillus wentii DTO 134E9 TaxID=1073089 RepID=A0A1L9RWH3_ASPWE|nr:uncharacterized protein ASPWEDRAFT_37047 [Aspergillus wentii DTO 134E9]KAI9929018.1 hypothetical protein MW887_001413 [Aspergillus wentii]OJJ39291.1 hypothetical protein ASPWEDRAFT_37047 [Aspergillus wentii DTO 134E9]